MNSVLLQHFSKFEAVKWNSLGTKTMLLGGKNMFTKFLAELDLN